jgi:hypothetical protein
MYGSLQKLAQLRRGLELRDRVQFFECGRERIRKTSDGPRTEFLVLRLGIQIMNGPGEMLWCLRFAFDESLVDDNFCCDIRDLTPLPLLYLLAHRFEIPLHSVDADRNAVNEREGFECLASTGVKSPLKAKWLRLLQVSSSQNQVCQDCAVLVKLLGDK